MVKKIRSANIKRKTTETDITGKLVIDGKGKGDIDHWVCVVKRGKIIFELGGVPEEYARLCFRLVAYKLPLKTKFITRASEKE